MGTENEQYFALRLFNGDPVYVTYYKDTKSLGPLNWSEDVDRPIHFNVQELTEEEVKGELEEKVKRIERKNPYSK